MRTFCIFFISLVLSNFSSLNAQGWERTITYEGVVRPYNVWQLEDDNFLVELFSSEGLGVNEYGTYYMLLNEDGETLWTKEIQDAFPTAAPYVHLPCSDGNFLAKGSYIGNIAPTIGTPMPSLLKLNTVGDTLWEARPLEQFGYQPSAIISSVFENADGSFTSYGRQTISNDPEEKYIINVDENGNTLWVNELDWAFNFDILSLPIRNENDGFIFTRTDDTNIYVYETDEEGSLQDSTIYLLGMYANTPIGNGNNVTKDGKMLRGFDSNHNLVFETDLLPDTDFLTGSLQVIDDGIIIVGGSEVPQNPNTISRIHLIKTDFDGNILWSKTQNAQSGIQEQQFWNFDTCNDGGVIVGAINFSFNGETAYIFKTDHNGDIYSNAITGNIALDLDDNCLVDATDQALNNWLVIASNEEHTFSGTSDITGHYFVPADSGDYVVSLIPPSIYWEACANDFEVVFDGFYSQEIIDFSVVNGEICPHMAVNGAAPTIRPCFERPYFVSYCNYGSVTAENAFIEIQFDPFITPVSSTFPWSSVSADNIYTFELGDIEPLQCDTFSMSLFLDCDAQVGLGYCIDIHAYPDTLCSPASSLWSGAFLEVDGTCEGDNINFRIENIGDGDMNGKTEFIIVEDAVLLIQDSVELNSGEFEEIPILSDGSTYTIISDQVPFAPGNSMPIAVVEACGNDPITIGFVNQFAFNEIAPYVDEDCPIAISSFDPNDKQGFPMGYGDEHYIEPHTKIEYMIRFQNTGTDVAYQVVIADELDDWLDISTFQAGSSSHSYEYKIVDRKLEFMFRNINLPDSTANLEGSNGFVEFSIRVDEDAPIGTTINNEAAIYFDYNPAIITNQTNHTIGVDYIEILVDVENLPIGSEAQIKVYPNPFMERAVFEILDVEQQHFQMEIFDATGKRLLNQSFNINRFELDKSMLSSGIYFYKITGDKGFSNSGKIIAR